MKLALITFSDFNTNYGSILQAIGLKTYLESQGHTVTFIRYREFNKIPKGSLLSELRSLCIRGYYLLHSSRLNQRKRNFDKYIQVNIPHTRLFTNEVDLEKNLPTFDAYICGSDQIWNIPSLGGLREPYFLKFAPDGCPKIAYAPSMGEYKLEDTNRTAFLDLVSRLDYLSSRERNSALLLEHETGRNVVQVVDPTLLLSSEEWLQMCQDADAPNHEYGVCYFVRRNKLCEKMVLMLRRKYGVPIYNLSDNLIDVPGTSNKYVCSSPDAFVKMVAHAKFCVGTSFHLAAFSTIFCKECYIAETAHNRERIESLFELTNSTRYLIRSLEDMAQVMSDSSPINHTREYKLKVNESYKYLNNSINGSKS